MLTEKRILPPPSDEEHTRAHGSLPLRLPINPAQIRMKSNKEWKSKGVGRKNKYLFLSEISSLLFLPPRQRRNHFHSRRAMKKQSRSLKYLLHNQE